jgi:hypothetical protein
MTRRRRRRRRRRGYETAMAGTRSSKMSAYVCLHEFIAGYALPADVGCLEDAHRRHLEEHEHEPRLNENGEYVAHSSTFNYVSIFQCLVSTRSGGTDVHQNTDTLSGDR